MWIYQLRGEFFAVGYYPPQGINFFAVREFVSERSAADYVHYLNGGGNVNPC